MTGHLLYAETTMRLKLSFDPFMLLQNDAAIKGQLSKRIFAGRTNYFPGLSTMGFGPRIVLCQFRGCIFVIGCAWLKASCACKA